MNNPRSTSWTPSIWDQLSARGRRSTTPDGTVYDGVVHSSEWGSLQTMAVESLRQATAEVMKSPLQQMCLVTAVAERMMTRLGPMCGPAWRAWASELSSEVQVMGHGVPPVSDSDEIPEAPQVLPRGSVMVLEPGPELRPLSRVY